MKTKKAPNPETTLQYVDQSLLDFESSNPRLGGGMQGRTQDEIQNVLVRAPYYASELIDSLLKNGFIDYEPLVVKLGQKKGRYSVVEGNRRLAAIREILSNQDRYSGKLNDLKRIPVLVFPEGPDEHQKSEMRAYLGVRHLLGIREWPPLSKALFLEHESKQTGGLDRVLKEIQLGKADARRFLLPYRLLKHAQFELSPEIHYWMLGEALGRNGIKKFLQLEVDTKTLEIKDYNKKNLAQLLDCLYGPKLGNGKRDPSKKVVQETRDLGKFARILGSKNAMAALRKGRKLEEAEIFVDSRKESLDRLASTTKSLGVLVKKLSKGITTRECKRLNKVYDDLKNAVVQFTNKEP